jgi:hypothetical protein
MQIPTMTSLNASSGYKMLGEDALERRGATRRYERMLGKGRSRRMLARLTGRSRELAHLPRVNSIGQHYLGLRDVPLAEIRGTENRSTEFDIDFYPVDEYIEQRWVSVAAARARGVVLPPVELVLKDGIYYVRDGHHRISVARSYGQQTIEAIVIAYDD